MCPSWCMNVNDNCFLKNEYCSALFMDICKAFDCIDHKLLLSKMESHGICGIVLNWFKSNLDSRQQYVSVYNKTVKCWYLSTDVPQGSILGPLLYIIYVDDLPSISNKLRFIIYADDITTNPNPNINLFSILSSYMSIFVSIFKCPI